jgi:hypothetical protein
MIESMLQKKKEKVKKQKDKFGEMDLFLKKEAKARHVIIFLSDAKLINRTVRNLEWL